MGESWADFAEYLKSIADKAYPDLEEKARERLALKYPSNIAMEIDPAKILARWRRLQAVQLLLILEQDQAWVKRPGKATPEMRN